MSKVEKIVNFVVNHFKQIQEKLIEVMLNIVHYPVQIKHLNHYSIIKSVNIVVKNLYLHLKIQNIVLIHVNKKIIELDRDLYQKMVFLLNLIIKYLKTFHVKYVHGIKQLEIYTILKK